MAPPILPAVPAVRATTARAARLGAYDSVSAALSRLDGPGAARLLAGAVPLGTGIGGRTARVEVAGVPVFVKTVPLTGRELRTANLLSTANLFDLPAFCHYGLGSPGFGVWREVAAHGLTTDWVLMDECRAFPLLYHWRVVPDSWAPDPAARAEHTGEVERMAARWGGSPAVRARAEELGRATHSVVLFLEHVPTTLGAWLGRRLAGGGEGAEVAWELADEGLRAGTAFLESRGLLHFDAHFENILTDGRQLYFTDFGLALHERFAQGPAEAAFFREHRGYDRHLTATLLVNRLVTALHGLAEDDRDGRDALVRKYAEGAAPDDLSPSAARIIGRDAQLAAAATEFHRAVQGGSLHTPYPRLPPDGAAG
ncbi:hypothetical protein [Kitasatospora sp. MBT63]|uniref:hypothetical protein n=1 Tax=Kitasatospora sp. MBT63 TaxID=1444768 RepID=UPI0005397291|nr:hypothetical protein [Kitasatospora sp. MBT63]